MGIYLDVGVTSDVGDRRKINEDSILVKTCYLRDNEIGMFLVADGMGGTKNGREASTLVSETLSFWWDHYFIDMLLEGKSISDIIKSLDDTIKLTNRQLCINNKKSGTTLSLLLIFGDIFIIRNIGDSRVYLINKKITQLTKDHSYVEALNERGLVLKDDPTLNSKRNLITNCIGINNKLEIFEKIDKVFDDDVFLICSDGFYGAVSEPEIMKVVFNRYVITMQDKARELRKLIDKGKAIDNVSIILVKQSRE